MKKYYAVRKGKEKGIFESWEVVKPLVTGYKGAEFKSFKTLAEAQDYIKQVTAYNDNKDFDALEPHEMVAYVDGSYNIKTRAYGYGVVTFTAEGKKTYKGSDVSPASAQRNVAGEIKGALFATKKALENDKTVLYLHYDYAGIEKWAKGEWKTNLPITQNYKAFMQKAFDHLEVHFIKIKAHSGDLYNDEADILAKEAVGLA